MKNVLKLTRVNFRVKHFWTWDSKFDMNPFQIAENRRNNGGKIKKPYLTGFLKNFGRLRKYDLTWKLELAEVESRQKRESELIRCRAWIFRKSHPFRMYSYPIILPLRKNAQKMTFFWKKIILNPGAVEKLHQRWLKFAKSLI